MNNLAYICYNKKRNEIRHSVHHKTQYSKGIQPIQPCILLQPPTPQNHNPMITNPLHIQTLKHNRSPQQKTTISIQHPLLRGESEARGVSCITQETQPTPNLPKSRDRLSKEGNNSNTFLLLTKEEYRACEGRWLPETKIVPKGTKRNKSKQHKKLTNNTL